MPEEQAFCVLVKLMFDYDFRDLYTPKMIGLQLRNHQFDRLLAGMFFIIHSLFPLIHFLVLNYRAISNRLQTLGKSRYQVYHVRLAMVCFLILYRTSINLSLYPTTHTRFMTLFAYRFPLDLVYRIMDVILAEGAESVLRFALALVRLF
jgi:hypothetical protein